MIHLACIVDGAAAPDDSDQTAPEVVVALGDELACVGRWCDERVPPTDTASLVGHDRLVQRWLHTRGGVVPFRYGSVVVDAARLRAELAPREAEFRDLLARLRGRVELALRARPAADGPSAQPSQPDQADWTGRSYLRALEATRKRPPWQQLHRTLTGSAVAAVAAPDGHGGIKASYLVESTDTDSFCRLLETTVADMEELGPVSLTGPWAPYSFTATNDDRPLAAITGGSDGDQHG